MLCTATGKRPEDVGMSDRNGGNGRTDSVDQKGKVTRTGHRHIQWSSEYIFKFGFALATQLAQGQGGVAAEERNIRTYGASRNVQNGV